MRNFRFGAVGNFNFLLMLAVSGIFAAGCVFAADLASIRLPDNIAPDADVGLAVSAPNSLYAGYWVKSEGNRPWQLLIYEFNIATGKVVSKAEVDKAQPPRSRNGDPIQTRSVEESLVVGARGAVSRSALEAAANSGGPTVRVVARLSSSPQAGRALSTATGGAAEALANSVPTSRPTQLYTAEIPKALINLFDRTGLVRTSTTMMGGTAGTEIRFLPAATEFVTKFFK